MKRVIVELKAQKGMTMEAAAKTEAAKTKGFTLDVDFEAIPLALSEVADVKLAAKEELLLVRGEIDEKKEKELKSSPDVVAVWTDAEIVPFCDDCNEEEIPNVVTPFSELEIEEEDDLPHVFDLNLAASPCSPTDCQYWVAKGTINDVAKYLKCDRLWAKGIRGQNVVIGICDSGVDKDTIPAFIGGWSPTTLYTPGTAPSTSHGTMCAFDAIGMAPEAKILDIAVLQSSGGYSGLLSDAIRAYNWALNKYKADGTPQILSNSWGMFQKSWAPDYATNPNHPFTRKVVELINTGIMITFAAGNCGSQCPDNRCGTDTGPGKSIWGANGHPRSITVGAANILEQWIGYTSQGPAALDPKKPDFCAPSHFKGARSSDTGTSASCPVCAGVIALLKSHNPKLTQDEVKKALQETARNLCAPGWDPNSGYGMIQAEAAFNKLNFFESPLAHAMWIHGTSVHEEYPDRLSHIQRMGFYAFYEGKPKTHNWFHFAIPTPVIVDNRRLRLDSVMLRLLTDPDVKVTAVHIYDGSVKIESYDGLSLSGNLWFERFDVLNKYVHFGIGVSVGVKFGGKKQPHRIGFISAGGDFMK